MLCRKGVGACICGGANMIKMGGKGGIGNTEERGEESQGGVWVKEESRSGSRGRGGKVGVGEKEQVTAGRGQSQERGGDKGGKRRGTRYSRGGGRNEMPYYWPPC